MRRTTIKKNPQLSSRPSTHKRPAAKKKHNGLFWLVLLLAVIAAAAMAAFALAGRSGSRKTGEVAVRIPAGTSSREIAAVLKKEDVIDSEKDFLKQAESSGAADHLQAGLYRFDRGEPLEGIVAKLAQGIQAPEGVLTVPEGYSLNEIAAELASKTSITENQYKKAASATGKKLPLSGAGEAEDLEGFLFPSTYDLDPGLTADDIVSKQLDAFSRETGALPWARAEALGVTPYQALIVASMVEREAKVPDERPKIAAVIYNRLEAGMKLEVDATVQYAIGSWKHDLTQQDLDTESPYNTRLYSGMPPGPICNPGTDSIRAALEPAPVNYLFYVATGDAEGHHFFTASYDEFLKAKEGRQP